MDVPLLNENDLDDILSKADLSEYDFDLRGYLLFRYYNLKSVFNL